MDQLTFIVEIIKAIIWPVTLIILLLVLKKPFLRLVPSLEKVKYRDLELDFCKQVHQLAKEAKETLTPASDEDDDLKDELKQLTDIAHVSPKSALLEAWLKLESAAFQLLKRKDPKVNTSILKTPIQIGMMLENLGIINKSQKEIFSKLRNLRNAAAHATDFTFDTESAIEYIEMALGLISHLRVQK